MEDWGHEVAFAGDGWGAIAGLTSMQRCFDRIAVISGDDEVRRLCRRQDRVVADFADSAGRLAVCSGTADAPTASELRKKDVFISVHYALLPRYRGHHPAVWAVLNGEAVHGITIHIVNERLDAGPVLVQRSFECAAMNSREIMEACNRLTDEWLGVTVRDFVQGKINPQPQDEAQATWGVKRDLHDCVVDFRASCIELRRLFRALVRPYPLPMLRLAGDLHEITSASILDRPYFCTVGRVLNLDETGAYIKVRDGLLVVHGLQRNGVPVRPEEILHCGQRL